MHIHSLYIYPVKSLKGIEVATAEILASGALKHDRQFAINDLAGKVLKSKNTPLLHTLSLSQNFLNDIQFAEANGRTVEEQLDKLASFISKKTDQQIVLQENTQMGFPDDTHFPGPTWVGLETLMEVGKWFNEDWQQTLQRFRCNVVISGIPEFEEDHWLGKTIGNEQIQFKMESLCNRCRVPTLHLANAEVEPEKKPIFLKKRAEQASKELNWDHYYKLSLNSSLLAGKGLKLEQRMAITLL